MPIAKIPAFYRTFFLYIDPVICLIGIYIFFFDHQAFLESGAPQSITANAKLTPLIDFLLLCSGSYALFVFAMQILLLHQFKDAPDGLNLKIWRIVLFGILLIDLGLLVAMYTADPGIWNVAGWGRGEWSNYSILGVVTVLRTSFLLGVGFWKSIGFTFDFMASLVVFQQSDWQDSRWRLEDTCGRSWNETFWSILWLTPRKIFRAHKDSSLRFILDIMLASFSAPFAILTSSVIRNLKSNGCWISQRHNWI